MNKGYDKYISSKEWKAKRQEVFDTYSGYKPKCELCRNPNDLHIHHLNYENFTKEKLGDLVILCKKCHLKLVHGSSEEERKVFNYWITRFRDSRTVNKKRKFPEGMTFTIPLLKGKRYFNTSKFGKKFRLTRGQTYTIDKNGMPKSHHRSLPLQTWFRPEG